VLGQGGLEIVVRDQPGLHQALADLFSHNVLCPNLVASDT
jgi:hypothetical protein